MSKDTGSPEAIEDAELDRVQGAGSRAFITRDESDVTAFHGSEFNRTRPPDSVTTKEKLSGGRFASNAGGSPNV